MSEKPATLKDAATELRKELRCNCDLDNWEPEQSTGHSQVCRIHKGALAIMRGDWKWPRPHTQR